MDGEPSLRQLGSDERLVMLNTRRVKYVRLIEALELLPRRRKVEGMLPFGPRAIVRGSLVHTNEIMVLLGENYFVDVSAYEAVQIAKRRVQEIDRQIIELISTDALHLKEKRSVSFASDTKGGESLPDRGPNWIAKKPKSVPEGKSERAELLRRFAEGLEAAKAATSDQGGAGVVFLEEEYADQESETPVRVHGLPQGETTMSVDEEDEEMDTKMENDGLHMRSFEEEIAVLEELEMEEAAQSTAKEPTFGFRRGFLKKPIIDSDVDTSVKGAFSQPSRSQDLSSSERQDFKSVIIPSPAAPEKEVQNTPSAQVHVPEIQEASSGSNPETQEPTSSRPKSLFKQRMEQRRS